MRSQRLARWSGTALSPRTRSTCTCARVQASSPAYSRRFQSSTAVLAEEEAEVVTGTSRKHKGMVSINKDAYSTHQYYQHLKTLPSPPTSAALSSAKLSALHARLQLSSRIPLQSLAKCLVHPSADPDPRFNNLSFATLGSDILGYHAAELILATYPRLPMDVLYAAMKAYVGEEVCASITKEWGVEAAGQPGGEVDPGLLQFLHALPGNADVGNNGTLRKDVQATSKTWSGFPLNVNRASISDSYFGRDVPTAVEIEENPSLQAKSDEIAREMSRVTLDTASTSFVRALFGATYLHCGRDAAREFFDQHIRPRKLDVNRMFYFKQPTKDLGKLCAREGFERPVGRIVSETGRFSRNPVFVLGVFSGREKLGEGVGGSLDEARIRASISALKGWYLYSPVNVNVPSDAEMKKNQGQHWQPLHIDGGEIIV